MNAAAFPSERTPVLARLASPNWDLLCRSVLVAVLVILVHQFQWTGLRFATSEAILRMSARLGMGTARLSSDTIRVQAEFFQFVTACTFIDVFVGSIPLLWDLKQSLVRNFCRLTAAAVLLCGFNLLRLELGQILHAHHVPWTLAEDVLGGAAYFVVWIVLWRFRGGLAHL